MYAIRSYYVLSYENYYGVKRGSEQYNAIATSNIETSIATVLCGMPKGTDLTEVALAPYAESYLKSIGLKDSEIAALRAKLSTAPAFATPMKAGAVTQVEKYGHTLTVITSYSIHYTKLYEAGSHPEPLPAFSPEVCFES